MYSTHNEQKFVAAGRFIRTYFISLQIHDIVNEHNNTYARTSKMKPAND